MRENNKLYRKRQQRMELRCCRGQAEAAVVLFLVKTTYERSNKRRQTSALRSLLSPIFHLCQAAFCDGERFFLAALCNFAPRGERFQIDAN